MTNLFDNIYLLTREDVERTIPYSSHRKAMVNAMNSLWVRFQNYEKFPPIAVVDENGQVMAIAMITHLKNNDINLYDIVSFKPGAGTTLWKAILKIYSEKGAKNIKFRALKSALRFYSNKGIYYWGFDGKSYTVFQPLFGTIEEMKNWQNDFLKNPIVLNRTSLEFKAPPKKYTREIIDQMESLGENFYMRYKIKTLKEHSYE
jgi:hypothetical protein